MVIRATSTSSGKGHLHFELWHSGRPLNPTQFISF
jgi:murein DD-endopeptidase MepM/ murein hydrolase activator NlpD